MINRNLPIPLYYQLWQEIKNQIESKSKDNILIQSGKTSTGLTLIQKIQLLL